MSPIFEYFIFVFIASCGVIQLAAAYSWLKGLLFFRNRIVAYIFAILTIGGAFGWFFGWDNRLDEKILHPGLAGAQQTYYFFLATVASVIFTLIVTSAVNYQRSAKPEQDEGLGLLKERGYLEAIKYSLGMNKRDNDTNS